MADFAPLRNDLILRTARGEQVERPPIWVMRQAGRYLPEYHEAKNNRDFFECCRDPEVASTLTIQPIDHFDGYIDAAVIFSDILVIPQAMGMEVVMLEKQGPSFPHPLRHPSEQQYQDIMSRQIDVTQSLGYVYDAISMTRRRLKGRVPVIGFCGAPWTLLCYMVEGGGSKMFKEIKQWIYGHPQESKALLQRIAEVCVDHLVQQVKAGAQLVQVFDSWAGEMSPGAFDEFALPYLLYIANHLPERMKEQQLELVPMIVFAKGAWYALPKLCDSRYDVISLDWLHDPAEAYNVARAKGKVIQGNMDPGVLYGSDASITAAVEAMVKGYQGGKQGWICNLGHGVTPFVKPEKLGFYFQEVRRLTASA